MRVAAMIIGLLSSSLLAFGAGVSLRAFVILAIRFNGGFDSYTILVIATSAATVVFGGAGGVGAMFTLFDRPGVGTLLLLVCALGIVASYVAYPVLLSRIGPPAFEPVYPELSYYVVSGGAILAILVAAVMAFLSRERHTEETARTS
jgi:multisubunit Na+/H+ antiporter MnhB subunit